MISLLITAITPLSLAYLCYILYLAVMALYRAKLENSLTLTQKILGYPLLWFGLLIDFLTNISVCTLVFLEFPKEYLVTTRIIRLKKDKGWRGKLAAFICQQLDNIDPTGCHCKD